MSKLKFTVAGLALTVISIAGNARAQQTAGQQSPAGQTQSNTQVPGSQNPGAQNPGTQNPGTQNPGTQTPGTQNPGGQNPGVQTPGGQNPGQPGGQTLPGQTQRDQRGGNQGNQAGNQQNVTVEEALVKKIKKSNEAEIELAQLAQEKVEDQGFRQFTQKLIQDHQQMNQQLDSMVSTNAGRAAQGSASDSPTSTSRQPGTSQPSPGQNTPGQNAPGRRATNSDEQARAQAGQDAQNQPGAAGRQGEGRPGEGRQGQGRGQMAGMGGGRVPQILCTIMEEACDNNLEMTKKMLQEYEGQDFKMAFLGQQIVAHTASLAEMKAIESSGPAQLKALAQQASPKIQEHLDMAKQMAKKFEDDRGSEGRKSN